MQQKIPASKKHEKSSLRKISLNVEQDDHLFKWNSKKGLSKVLASLETQTLPRKPTCGAANLGSCCSTAVQHTPRNQEVLGSNSYYFSPWKVCLLGYNITSFPNKNVCLAVQLAEKQV